MKAERLVFRLALENIVREAKAVYEHRGMPQNPLFKATIDYAQKVLRGRSHARKEGE